MEIIPDLNLNKHPRNIKEGTLVDCVNMMVSKDGIIQTEIGTQIEQVINNAIYSKYNRNYDIIYCITCNIELIIFVKDTTTTGKLSIFRYNEEYNQCKFLIDNFEYSGGNLTGDFIYNKENLIIAISEYSDDDSLNIPLRTINFGKFPTSEDYLTTYDFLDSEDKNQLINPDLHPICPRVKIPTVNTEIINGNAPKGWHYIFIRYKISKDTYTQWFNTNEAIFIDYYYNDYFFKYYVSSDYAINDVPNGSSNKAKNSFSDIVVSNESNIANLSYSINITNLDTNYYEYQIGIINVSKDTTNGYISSNINININTIIFKDFNTYNITDITNRFYNYYNVKTICFFENKLYIANYKELIVNYIPDDNISINITYNNNQTNKNTLYEETVIRYYRIFDYSGIGVKSYLPSSIDTKVYGIQLPATDGGTNTNTIINLQEYGSNNGFRSLNNSTTVIVWIMYTYNDGKTTYTKNYYYECPLGNIYFNITPYKDLGYFEPASYYGIKGYSGTNNDIAPWDFIMNNGYTINDFRILTSYPIEVGDDNVEFTGFYFYLNAHNYDSSVYNTINSEVFYTINNNDYNYVLKSCGVKPWEYYSFYVHFINEYGEITNGIPINKFNTPSSIDGCSITIGNNNIYIMPVVYPEMYPKFAHYNKCLFTFQLQSIPNNYKGYFISYEKLEKTELYRGVNASTENGDNYIYNDIFNYQDTINIDFNKYKRINNGQYTNDESLTSNNYNGEIAFRLNYLYHTVNTYFNSTNYDISSVIKVADNYNNILYSTNISFFTEENDLLNQSIRICSLIDTSSKYNNKDKILIPCSKINYNNNNFYVNTKTAFDSTAHAIIFNNAYKDNVKVYFNDAIKVFCSQYVNIENNTNNVYLLKPLITYKFNEFIEVPNESICFNNKPATQFFPIRGLNTEDEKEKSFAVGCIVEAQNTIDLFKQPQVSYYDKYPIYYTNYTDDYTNIFPKTIRRSNVIQDESSENNIRKFTSEDYKFIDNTKGNIIKIFGVNNILLIHTQYSLFIFGKDNNVKTEDGNLKLSAVDIWDVDYIDLFNDKLGYGGLYKETHSINGTFGYVWYDYYHKEFFKLDGKNNIVRMDANITNFIKNINITDVRFAPDIKRERILINIDYNETNNITLSYHYSLNTFISRHIYSFDKAYATINNIYLIKKVVRPYIILFDESTHVSYLGLITQTNNESYIRVIINNQYDAIKFLDYITYKISKVDQSTDNFVGINIRDHYYPGRSIRIYNDLCDTGEVDLRTLNATSINNIANYRLPYFELGNWNYNLLRDNLAEYKQDTESAEDMTRIYGNWFVFELKLDTDKCVELENVYYKVSLV